MDFLNPEAEVWLIEFEIIESFHWAKRVFNETPMLHCVTLTEATARFSAIKRQLISVNALSMDVETANK